MTRVDRVDKDPPGTGQIDVEELRARLRGLGYLNAGVDRFVLAPAQRERSATRLAVLVSGRIGLVAALLLGPAAAIGVASRLPELIAGPRDALLVTVYLAIVFGAAATIASLLAAVSVGAFARRAGTASARRVAVASGWIVGIASLTYLTLWWNAMGTAWSAPGRTIAAIVAAVAVSLLLGHAVATAALALVAREHDYVRAPVMSWRAMVAIGLAAFLGAAGVLALSASTSRGAGPTPFAIVPTGVRVVLIGIDGFDPRLFAKWQDSGVVAAAPILQQLTTRVTAEPGDPAAVWTTVATGVPPQKHRVTGLQARRVLGLQGSIDPASPVARAVGGTTDLLRLTRPAPVSGLARRYKMIWEVAAEKGLNAAVLNWWATWPASPTGAVVLSDRAVLRLDKGGEPSGEIAPAALYAPLRHRWPEITKRVTALTRTFDNIPDQTVGQVLRRSAILDAQQALLARDPLLGSPDLLAVYLPGLDIAQHELLQSVEARTMAPSVLADRLAFLPAYHYFLDWLLREALLLNVPKETVVIVVAHPGRVAGTRGAVLSMSGGPARSTIGQTATLSLEDLAPTVLYLLGAPISRELAGKPWLEKIDPEFVKRYPVRVVETYGAYAPDVAGSEAAPLDKEMLERLRSLGYIR